MAFNPAVLIEDEEMDAWLYRDLNDGSVPCGGENKELAVGRDRVDTGGEFSA